MIVILIMIIIMIDIMMLIMMIISNNIKIEDRVMFNRIDIIKIVLIANKCW